MVWALLLFLMLQLFAGVDTGFDVAGVGAGFDVAGVDAGVDVAGVYAGFDAGAGADIVLHVDVAVGFTSVPPL